jgi:membrane protease YdiL (CAAX protease family)
MPLDFALILFVLGVLVPWRGTQRIRELLRQPFLSTADRLALYASTLAFQWLLTGVTLWRAVAHRLSLQRLGVAMPDPALVAATATALTLVLLVNQILSLRRLARLPAARQGFLGEMARKVMPQNLVESLAFVALVSTVALCEELLYRGFVFAALQDAVSNSVTFAIIGSSAFFSLAHLYQGRRGLLSTFLVGLLFAGVRAWTGSLAPCIVTHLVADLAAGLAAPRMLRAAAVTPPPANPISSTGPEGAG